MGMDKKSSLGLTEEKGFHHYLEIKSLNVKPSLARGKLPFLALFHFYLFLKNLEIKF